MDIPGTLRSSLLDESRTVLDLGGKSCLLSKSSGQGCPEEGQAAMACRKVFCEAVIVIYKQKCQTHPQKGS